MSSATAWKQTACNLCYANCGVEVQLGGPDGRSMARVKGDKAHPASKGYTCNKALQLDYYQNGRDRLKAPLRRRADGSFEAISWDVAIAEIAEKLAAVRDAHGGEAIFYLGGGGQGNHLGGSYAVATRAALGIKYRTNALAQEKTGFAWMMGRMIGANVHGELHHAQTVLIVGKNPWQSNGFQRARLFLREIQKDPERTLIVMDPRRTETAEHADIHLAVTPGRDAWCLSAMIAVIVQENLLPLDWLEEHANGLDAVRAVFEAIPADAYARFAGVDPAAMRAAARAIATAKSAAYYEDLGVQMAPHSALCSYLNHLLMLITGNFGKPDTMGVLAQLAPFFSMRDIGEPDENHIERAFKTTPVTGARIVSDLVPCNAVPEEILTDHPKRFRAMIIESSNPAHSMAESATWRAALRALDCVVVIDVAMTETARQADYVLPAPSQYEKWEATFFNFEYPANVFHLRAPLMAPVGDTLAEPEIHARLVEALGAFAPGDLDALKDAAKNGLSAYGQAFFAAAAQDRRIMKLAPYVLYRTLGPSLPDGAAAAAGLWGLVQLYAQANPKALARAGFTGEGFEPGNALFEKMLSSRSGVVFGVEAIEESFERIPFPDKKLRLAVGEMLAEVETLSAMAPLADTSADFPLVLAAGERRSYTANTAIRDPRWMKSNNAEALAMHPDDAAKIGLSEGARARLATQAGEAMVVVTLDDRMRRGAISLPNGLGLLYPDEQGVERATGVAPNDLTSLAARDRFMGTPWHKFVPARLEPA